MVFFEESETYTLAMGGRRVFGDYNSLILDRALDIAANCLTTGTSQGSKRQRYA